MGFKSPDFQTLAVLVSRWEISALRLLYWMLLETILEGWRANIGWAVAVSEEYFKPIFCHPLVKHKPKASKRDVRHMVKILSQYLCLDARAHWLSMLPQNSKLPEFL
jgi:hypothetical protein